MVEEMFIYNNMLHIVGRNYTSFVIKIKWPATCDPVSQGIFEKNIPRKISGKNPKKSGILGFKYDLAIPRINN